MNVSVLNFGNTPVSFRQDGFLNATAIASHFGKLPKDYLKSEQTQQYISALAENLSVRRKILTEANQIVIVKRGGSEQGTWLHPKLAIHFARWLNPKFAVWCDEQIEILLNGKISDGIKTVTPKPTRALPDGLTGEQIEAVKKLHNALTKSAPKEAQARIAITLWSAVKSKFGCSYKEVPAEQFPEVLSVMGRVAVENGVLYGEVLDREPLPAPQPALPISGKRPVRPRRCRQIRRVGHPNGQRRFPAAEAARLQTGGNDVDGLGGNTQPPQSRRKRPRSLKRTRRRGTRGKNPPDAARNPQPVVGLMQ